jgi:hypothetical protein
LEIDEELKGKIGHGDSEVIRKYYNCSFTRKRLLLNPKTSMHKSNKLLANEIIMIA